MNCLVDWRKSGFDIADAGIDADQHVRARIIVEDKKIEICLGQMRSAGFWITPEGTAEMIFGTSVELQDRLLSRAISLLLMKPQYSLRNLNWIELLGLACEFDKLEEYLLAHLSLR